MPVLQIHNISKRYQHHLALDDVTLDVQAGAMFGLLGPNGAGKTTLIRIITQIIQADSGSVLLNGEPMRMDDVMKIGYLPEERGLYKKMLVGEHLLYLARLKGLSKADALHRINSWVDKLGLRAWINKRIEDLSKGMQQKVQFIGTVVNDPSILILDEPFSGFDPVNADIIKQELLSLKQNGTTIIYSTHRMEAVEELCDYLAIVNKSKLVLKGSKQEIKFANRNGTFRAVYENVPVGDFDAGEVISREMKDGFFQVIFQSKSNQKPSDMLQQLDQNGLIAFGEVIPSIEDIFIKTVADHD